MLPEKEKCNIIKRGLTVRCVVTRAIQARILLNCGKNKTYNYLFSLQFPLLYRYIFIAFFRVL